MCNACSPYANGLDLGMAMNLTWGCHNLLGQVCYCALEKEKEKETKGV
jgi:hypothetical protein